MTPLRPPFMGAAPQAQHAPPLHVAIIMDGNGRWATNRGLPRTVGHGRGAEAVRRAVEAAPSLGIDTLTLYGFSSDNWRRPKTEIVELMSLFEEYLRCEVDRCIEYGIRLSVVGRRDRLPPALRRHVNAAEELTAPGAKFHLRLAIDYSARTALAMAAEHMAGEGRWSCQEFAARVRSGRGEWADGPDVDLVIRTGGEKRLSDFLLWESAYAELWFTDTAWPDFSAEEFQQAMAAFAARQRRFGGVAAS